MVRITRNAGDPGLIPGSGRLPGEGNDNQLQYSCLENPSDSGAWRAPVHGVAKSDMTERLTLEESKLRVVRNLTIDYLAPSTSWEHTGKTSV